LEEPYPRVTICVLPDDGLLEIFVYSVQPQEDLYSRNGDLRGHEHQWRTLVHVCKQWRYIVFASQRRLDLRLFCTNTRPVKKLLDIWPPLPIFIEADRVNLELLPLPGVTHLMAALKQSHRVFGIDIDGVPDSLLKRIGAIKSFPALEHLTLRSYNGMAKKLPDSFWADLPHVCEDSG
jgi:hypothetical protein